MEKRDFEHVLFGGGGCMCCCCCCCWGGVWMSGFDRAVSGADDVGLNAEKPVLKLCVRPTFHAGSFGHDCAVRKSGYLTHGHRRIPHQSILIRLAPVCPIMVSKRRQHFPEANATPGHAQLRKNCFSLKAHRHSRFLACYVK